MKMRLLTCITLLACLSGCSSVSNNSFHDRFLRSSYGLNTAGYPTPTEQTNPVTYLQAYVKADDIQGPAPLEMMLESLRWNMEENKVYTTISVPGYRPNDGTRTSGHLLIGIHDVCTKKGGLMSGHWCFRTIEKKTVPMFYFEASDVYNFSKPSTIQAKLIVPSNGDETTSAWLNYAVPLFEADAKDMYAKQIMTKEETAATIRHLQTLMSRVKNKPIENQFLLSPKSKGTKVCRAERQNAVSIGFVEDSGADRIKINVVFYGYPPNLTFGGFRPHTIWDYPNDWWVCH